MLVYLRDGSAQSTSSCCSLLMQHAGVSQRRISAKHQQLLIPLTASCWCISETDQHTAPAAVAPCYRSMLVYLRDGSAHSTSNCCSVLPQHADVSQRRISTQHQQLLLRVTAACWCISEMDQHKAPTAVAPCYRSMLVYLRDGSAQSTSSCCSVLPQHAGVSQRRISTKHQQLLLRVTSACRCISETDQHRQFEGLKPEPLISR